MMNQLVEPRREGRVGAPNLEELLEGRSRLLRPVVVILTLSSSLGLAVYAMMRFLPPQPYGIATDYRVFYAAAKLLSSGQNPYPAAALNAAEQSVEHYHMLQPALDSFAYLPITATLLEPLTKLPFWASYLVFTALGVSAAVTVITFLAKDLEWSYGGVLVAGTLISWVTLLGFTSGQFDALLLAVLIGSMLLAWRDRPLFAGMLMGLVWMKPDLLWPAPLFLFLALWPSRRSAARFAAGFSLTTVACLFTNHELLPAWLTAVRNFSHSIGTTQPDLAGLPALAQAAPSSWHLSTGLLSPGSLIVILASLLAMGIFAVWMIRSSEWSRLTPVNRIAWGVALPMGLWLVATPYSHTNDDLLLLPLLMLTLGRDLRRVNGPGLGLSLAVVIWILLIWPGSVIPPLPGLAVLAAVGFLVWRSRTSPYLTGFGAGLALLCFAFLPPVAPWHLLAVSLTPVAALVLVVEGCRVCWAEVGGASFARLAWLHRKSYAAIQLPSQ